MQGKTHPVIGAAAGLASVATAAGDQVATPTQMTTRRINLTHGESPDFQGVMPRTPDQQYRIGALLTFAELPDEAKILQRVRCLCRIAVAEGATEAVISGPPYLLLYLDPALRMLGIQPLYIFSLREDEGSIYTDFVRL
jgi:hypothetical protein